MNKLKDKVSIITGGAMGIGEATSMLFAEEGSKVVVADIDERNGKRVAENIKNKGGNSIFFKIDVTKEDDWKNIINYTINKYGLLNILVNNAGISMAKDIEETTIEDWNRVMTVNATGVFLGTKYAILAMKKNDQPCSIINRSSIDGKIAEEGLFAYCASKGAVTILTKSAALACGKKGYKIRVNSVHPGYVHTNLTEEEAKGSGYSPEAYFKKVGKLHPIGFIGKPIDVAYLVLFLASDESKWVTGAEFVVDGGWTAQ